METIENGSLFLFERFDKLLSNVTGNKANIQTLRIVLGKHIVKRSASLLLQFLPKNAVRP